MTVIGADPKLTQLQKSNLANATGLQGKGTDNALAVEWVYGEDAQPTVQNPIGCITAWLRLLDETDLPMDGITKGWSMRWSIIEGLLDQEEYVWGNIASSMSACSSLSLDPALEPSELEGVVAPDCWPPDSRDKAGLLGDSCVSWEIQPSSGTERYNSHRRRMVQARGFRLLAGEWFQERVEAMGRRYAHLFRL